MRGDTDMTVQTYHSAYPGSMFKDREPDMETGYVTAADHQAAIREIARLEARLGRVWNEVLNQGREVAFQCHPNMQKIEDAFNEPPESEAKS